jgi:hypothetical protein
MLFQPKRIGRMLFNLTKSLRRIISGGGGHYYKYGHLMTAEEY